MLGPEIRSPQPHELDAFARSVETGFSIRLRAVERERYLDSIDASHALAVFVDGELVGTFRHVPAELTLPGPVLSPCAAVTDVTVAPTHRRRGLLSAMMRRFLDERHADGTALAALIASEGGIYGRFGFGPATWGSTYLIERHQASVRASAEGSGRVRLIDLDEARGCAPAVFDAARRLRPGELERKDTWWDETFPVDPTATALARTIACYTDGTSIDGYVVYDVTGDWSTERELRLIEIVAATSDAHRALWAFVLGLDAVARLRTLPLSTDEPVAHLLVDPRALRTIQHADRSWLRLIDVQGALRLRRYDGAGEVTFLVHDEWCPWNDGPTTLVVGPDGVGRTGSSAAPTELALGSTELAMAYLGSTSFSTLVRAGRVAELTPGAARRADLLFSTDPVAFCTTEF